MRSAKIIFWPLFEHSKKYFLRDFNVLHAPHYWWNPQHKFSDFRWCGSFYGYNKGFIKRFNSYI